MAIFDIFSKRQKRLRGEVPDVYQYPDIPQVLRVQVIHIVRETIGDDYGPGYAGGDIYDAIHKTLCREYGLFTLNERAKSNSQAIFEFFLNEKNHERCLDFIELSFKYIHHLVREDYYRYQGNAQTADDAIDELNNRFKETGLGYQFESGEIVKVDSQFIHSEVVKPTLQILGNNIKYQGVNDEFLSAHAHYRHQNYKECLNDCLKSFESLMKSIHVDRGWDFNQNDTAKKLINGCLVNGLIPEYMQNEFSSLRSLLESGIPTIRNKEGGHGQGHEVTNVPEHLASYALHLTASTLLFLAKCDEKL